jgi:hypothetical protein
MILIGAVLASCQTTPRLIDNDALKNYNYTFIFEDTPSLQSSDKADTICLSLFIYNNGRRFTPENLDEMRLSNAEGGRWSFEPKVTTRYVGGWLRLMSSKLSKDDSIESITPYTIEIDTNDGTTYRETIDLSNLLPMTNPSQKLIVGQTKDGVFDSGNLSALARAKIDKAQANATGLRLRFSIPDKRAISGRVLLYDETWRVIGWTADLVDLFSGKCDSTLNNGTSLFVDGASNNVDLPVTSIRFLNGDKSLFNSIKSISVDVFSGQLPIENVLATANSAVLLTHSVPATVEPLSP